MLTRSLHHLHGLKAGFQLKKTVHDTKFIRPRGPFLFMDDVTSMSLVGSQMALDHSVTHSLNRC